VLGGFWYSLPAAGECKATQDVGTDGCTWKLEKMSKWVNSSCVGSLVEKGVRTTGSCMHMLHPETPKAAPEPGSPQPASQPATLTSRPLSYLKTDVLQ